MQNNLIDLAPNRLHLWCCFDQAIKDPVLLDQYEGLLNDEEKAKQRRFHFERHQHQYLVTRALVRTTLSFYRSILPQDWRFVKNEYGRPGIAPDLMDSLAQPDLEFNLSHTNGLIVLAIATGADIGVDVENLHRRNDVIGVADRYFSPSEVTALHSHPVNEQYGRFFDYWTLKEAYIKARGMGLSIPLEQFSFDLANEGEILIDIDPRQQDDPKRWQFWRFKPSNEHQIAVAWGEPRQSAKTSRPPITIKSRQIVPLKSHCSLELSSP